MADAVVDVAGYLTLLEAFLLVFNLLPAYPLDGGQMLQAWLWRRSGDAQVAFRTAVKVSTVIGYSTVGAAVVLLATGRLSAGFSAAFAGGLILFMLWSFSGVEVATAPARTGEIEVVGDLLRQRAVVVPETSSLNDFLDRVADGRGQSTHAFAVTRNGVLVGYTSVGLAHQVPAQERDRSTVFDTMVRWEDAIQLAPHTPLEQALEQLADAGDRGIVVDSGRVTGIVVRETIAAALLEASDERRGLTERAKLPW